MRETVRTIAYFNTELTVEEFVKKEICKNAGTQSIAFKLQLTTLCDDAGVDYENKMSKSELFDLLIKNGYDHEKLAEIFGVGVSSQTYQKAFGISHQDVKRLEKHGVLKVVGEYRFRAFGEYRYAPLYSVYQYAKMTDENMQRLLLEYPKGKRTQPAKIDKTRKYGE